ncbi:dynein heavy chain 1, cytosolic, partial [Puccinia sorghi]
NRFNNINAGYLGLMKRVFMSPYVLDVIQIPELLKTLDKLVKSLGKLQKALGEYLEREWSSFPRPIILKDYPKINDWLTKLKTQMQTSLAEFLKKINSFNGLNDRQCIAKRNCFLSPVMRRKCEHLITELVHQRDVIRLLIKDRIDSITCFKWLYHMCFYLNPSIPNPTNRLSRSLTDRCYLTLTQALHGQLGGSPFGPAGTGKTESVKALGVQLGRF